MKRFLLQAVTNENHLIPLHRLLTIPHPEAIIISVAFMNEGGLTLIEDRLGNVAEDCSIYVGIRNGVTSAQGIRKALELGCEVYAVDTGSRLRIFHPKVYYSRNLEEAHLITGSANLTLGGLSANIEASIWQVLALDDEENKELADDLEAKFDDMVSEYPDHVFEIEDEDHIEKLLDAGRLIDETVAPPPDPVGSSRNRDLDTIPKMPLKTSEVSLPRRRRARRPRAPAGRAAPPTSLRDRWDLVWESRELTRRYLTIPTAEGTNPTGSMLFTKGALEDIDQRHFFRDEVFRDLAWAPDTDPKRKHLERARAQFRLIIRDIDYGVFTLRLTHNTRTDTRAYEQANSMTQLHWGAARPYVAREDLLDRTMRLYRDRTEDDLFIIEID